MRVRTPVSDPATVPRTDGSGPDAQRPRPSPSIRWSDPVRFSMLLVGLVVVLGAVTLAAVGIGAVVVPVDQTWRIIVGHLLPGVTDPVGSAIDDQIIWEFRLPRALLATMVGSTLALAGAVLQALVRNPLAEPFLLGVSQGASFGAVLVFVLGSLTLGGLVLSAAAFGGALLATALVYLTAQRSGRITPSRLILAGVALAFLFQALYSYVLQKADSGRAAQAILFWLLGSLGGARWDVLAVPAVVLGAGLMVLLVQYRPLNALVAGDETAISLGVDVNRLRVALFVVTSLLVGVVVAVSGAIAFVGLIIPHAARLIVGADHRRVLPVTALLGAIFLQLVDIVARTLDAPTELPLSIVTAVVGVPFFLWLLRRRTPDRVELTA